MEEMNGNAKHAVETLVEGSNAAIAIAEPEDDFQDEIRVKTPIKQPKRPKRDPNGCKHQLLKCCKKTIVYMLSYIGLVCSVVAYSILGGIIFPALEAPNEKEVQKEALALRVQFTEYFEKKLYYSYHNYKTYNISYNRTGEVEEKLKEFQRKTYDLISSGWSGADGEDKWNFAGGLLFAVTVITTIGYGFTAPKTVYGQAVTMLYAIIGIPLMFLCLSNIGRAMASLFRALYGKALCVNCRATMVNNVMRRRQSTVSADKIELDKLDNPDAVNTTVTTETHTHKEDVPFFVCLILVAWYIVFGAALFTIWETSWDLFTGTYFCFITLSTIGFGDIVPGLSREEWDDNVKQVACSLYLLVGLSLLAMCFELMQEKGRVLAKQIATFLGLVKKK